MTTKRPMTIAAAIALACPGLFSLTSCSPSSTTTPSNPDAGTDADSLDAGADASLPDSAGAPCNPVKQDCADPSLRCKYISDGKNHTAACEPSNGDPPAQEGDVCTRGELGIDNCVIGTYCFNNGGSGALACRKTCATDAQCGAGAKCTGITTKAPYFGVCYPTCTPFGTDCGAGTCANSFADNDGVNSFDGCRSVGTTGVGQSCGAQWDCKPDMNCTGLTPNSFTCNPMCDDAHPCGDAGACFPFSGLPKNGGVCP